MRLSPTWATTARAAVDERGHHRGAHAGVVVVALRGPEHAAIRQVQGRPQPVGQKRQIGQHAVGPGQVAVARRAAHEPAQRFKRQRAGHLAGVVAAHAVGHCIQVLIGVHEKRIFIDGPDRARVRGGVS